jgi:hypothetical protein
MGNWCQIFTALGVGALAVGVTEIITATTSQDPYAQASDSFSINNTIGIHVILDASMILGPVVLWGAYKLLAVCCGCTREFCQDVEATAGHIDIDDQRRDPGTGKYVEQQNSTVWGLIGAFFSVLTGDGVSAKEMADTRRREQDLQARDETRAVEREGRQANLAARIAGWKDQSSSVNDPSGERAALLGTSSR